MMLLAGLAGCSQVDSAGPTTASEDPASAAAVEADSGSGGDAASADQSPHPAELWQPGTHVTLEIPEMHCPFVCYPKAKETLEGLDGIASVELVPQKEEGVIDDRRVIVTVDGPVSPETVIAALDQAELPGARVDAAQEPAAE